MEYQYYNQFGSSKQLEQSISSIVSKKEQGKFVCSVINIVIPEHIGLIWSSPLDGYNAWGGGLNALSGAQRREVDEKYGKYVEGKIPASGYQFLVVAEQSEFQRILKLKFKDEDNFYTVKRILEALCEFCAEYDGVSFDARALSERFPYLQAFFTELDEWRAKTGRVTLDDDILGECTKRAMTSHKVKSIKNPK